MSDPVVCPKSEFPTLAKLREALADWNRANDSRIQPEPPPGGEWLAEAAEELIAELNARVITTAERLNSYWPTSTVIREEPRHEWDFYPQIWEMAYQCGWTRAGEKYNPEDDSPRLPALLIWHPDWATS